MTESRKTQEIVRAAERLTRLEAVKFREALLAAGITCQIAHDPAATPGAELWLRGADYARAQEVLAACRSAAAKSQGQS